MKTSYLYLRKTIDPAYAIQQLSCCCCC